MLLRFCWVISAVTSTYFVPFNFFLFSLFFKKKKKTILFFVFVHIYGYTFSNISPPFLLFYLPIALYFTGTFPSSFFLSYIFTIFFPHFCFCINSISFLSFNPYFSHKKTMSSLSLSRFLFFLIPLIKAYGFFFSVLWYCVF